MQLVRRPDALALHRLRHPVCAVREHAIHPLRELVVRCRCMVLFGRRPGSRLPYRRKLVTSLYYLFRDAPQRRAALELEPGFGGTLRAPRVWISSPRADTSSATTSSGPQPAAWARPAGAALKRRPRGRRRVRRRLRDSALVAPPAQSGRRRALDGRHRGHPADAPRAGACRSPAVRLRGDRPAGTARAAPFPAHGAALRPRARWGGRDRHVQRARGGRPHPLARGAGDGRHLSSSCPSASTSRRSDRRARRPVSTSSPLEPTHIATSVCSSRRHGRCPRRASSP